jgi:serum/glucocorticoid-regulated kinase 2
LSHEIKWIICDLLKKDPRERLGSNQGVREILAHPWLRKINTRAILSKQTDPPLKPNLLEFNVDEKDVPQNDSEIR